MFLWANMWNYELHKNAGTVNYQDWNKKGIMYPIFDIDGTLTSHQSVELDQNVVDGFKKQSLADIFPNIAIATNNPDLEHVELIAHKLESALGLEVYIASVGLGLARKPNRQQGDKIAQYFGVTNDRLAVVGDRRISDIKFARNLGAGAMALCVKVGQGDAPFVPFVRYFERKFLVKHDLATGRACDAEDYLDAL